MKYSNNFNIQTKEYAQALISDIISSYFFHD